MNMLKALTFLLLACALAACQPPQTATPGTTPVQNATVQSTPAPAPYVLVRHKVEDFETWKAGFDAHSKVRDTSGSHGGLLFRNAEDPSEVVILLKWEDMEQAHAFIGSDDLRETMGRLGVSDQPDVYFLDEVSWFPR